MKQGLILLVFLCLQNLGAQELDRIVVDSLYREDQFYAGVTYNLLVSVPKNLSQSGFSGGYHFGFIRDMPINEERNIAIGLGLGLSFNSFNQNLLIDKDNSEGIEYSILENSGTYSKNKFSQYIIEAPFEFRWRTSTPTSYKFWRIYTGFKLGYLFAHRTKYNGELGSISHSDISDFNNVVYGLTLSAGYNTWNIHFYYQLNSIFSKEAQLNEETIIMSTLKIGLIFYIL